MTTLKGNTPSATYTLLLYREPSPAGNTPNMRWDDGVGGQVNSALDLPIVTEQVNYITLEGATAGNPISVSAHGSDTNITLILDGKGTGGVQLGSGGGRVGFYGTTPIALQTGVAVSAAGIHAALVNLGLITA